MVKHHIPFDGTVDIPKPFEEQARNRQVTFIFPTYRGNPKEEALLVIVEPNRVRVRLVGPPDKIQAVYRKIDAVEHELPSAYGSLRYKEIKELNEVMERLIDRVFFEH